MSKLLKQPTDRVRIGRAPSDRATVGKRTARDPSVPKPRMAFALTPRFLIFLVVFYAARVFTQALRSPLSAIFYVFLLLLPLLSLLYVLICRFAIRIYLGDTAGSGRKGQELDFDMRLINDSPLLLPFLEADLLVPDEKRVRCRTKRVRLMILPRGHLDLAQKLVFPYRGEYRIGAKDLYVYDFFRILRVRKRLDTYMTITVLPRRLTLREEHRFSTTNLDSERVKNVKGADRAEVSNIRTYVAGDPRKSIHWKLSTKSEELMVKEYAHHAGNTVYIFADLSCLQNGPEAMDADWSFEDDVNEYLADGVVETAAALCDCALRSGHRLEILWYDERAVGGVHRFAMEDLSQGDRFFSPLSTARLVGADRDVTALTRLIEEDQGVSYLFVTGRLDRAVAKGVARMTALAGGDSVALYYVSPESRIVHPEQLERYRDEIRRNRRYLENRGVAVVEPDLTAMTDGNAIEKGGNA